MDNNVIAIVDPYSGGHHEAFIKLFSKAFLECGAEVWVFSQTDKNYILEDELLEKAFREKKILILPFSIRKRRIKRFWFLNDAVSSLLNWVDLNKAIKHEEQVNSRKVKYVYFAWLDAFLGNYLLPVFIDVWFKRKWAGLYFHPRHMRFNPQKLGDFSGKSDVDHVLTSKNCLCVHIHDRGIRERLSRRLDKQVVVIPETADSTRPSENHPVAKQIKNQANGRSIIGIIGLGPHQGLLHLVRLVKIAPSARYFFVFAGREALSEMDSKDRADWIDFKLEARENCFFFLERLEEGEDYNSVFNALDHPFLVYDNFASSSNRLTKAAIMQKLVIAQNEFCIGEDVVKFKLGVTIDGKRPEELLKTADWLLENNKTLLKRAEFDDYAQLNSYERLVDCFRQIFR